MEIRRIYDTIPFIYRRHRIKERWEQEMYEYGVERSCIHTTPRLIFYTIKSTDMVREIMKKFHNLNYFLVYLVSHSCYNFIIAL